MSANVQQTILELLEQYPTARHSYTMLCFTYWIKHDEFPYKKDFATITPVETVCREAREVWRRRPDLSPTANQSVQMQEFVQQVLAVFPGSELVDA